MQLMSHEMRIQNNNKSNNNINKTIKNVCTTRIGFYLHNEEYGNSDMTDNAKERKKQHNANRIVMQKTPLININLFMYSKS